jgi:hypothetical protein
MPLAPSPFVRRPSPLGALLTSPWLLGARVVAPRVFPGRAKSTHERGQCWWCSRAAAHRRIPHRQLESTDLGLLSPMLQMYVSSVLDVSEVCCNCYIWVMQKSIGMLHILHIFASVFSGTLQAF